MLWVYKSHNSLVPPLLTINPQKSNVVQCICIYSIIDIVLKIRIVFLGVVQVQSQVFLVYRYSCKQCVSCRVLYGIRKVGRIKVLLGIVLVLRAMLERQPVAVVVKYDSTSLWLRLAGLPGCRINMQYLKEVRIRRRAHEMQQQYPNLTT